MLLAGMLPLLPPIYGQRLLPSSVCALRCRGISIPPLPLGWDTPKGASLPREETGAPAADLIGQRATSGALTEVARVVPGTMCSACVFTTGRVHAHRAMVCGRFVSANHCAMHRGRWLS
jgi:hypothetical protein